MAATPGHPERHVMLSKTDFEGVNDALAWLVRTLDAEFDGAGFLNMTISQSKTVGMMVDDEWQDRWTASISGVFELSE